MSVNRGSLHAELTRLRKDNAELKFDREIFARPPGFWSRDDQREAAAGSLMTIDADGVVAVLDRLALQRGAPVYVRFDIHTESWPDRPVVVQLAA